MAIDRRLRRALIAGAAAALVAVTAWLVSAGARHSTAVPAPVVLHGRDVTGEAWSGAFALEDSRHEKRSLAQFAGKVVLLTFGYTHCPDACPTTLAKLAQVRAMLGPLGDRVQVLFVTVDPERDDAALLGRYAPQFDPTFLGLRGTEEQTDAATRAFHAQYQIIEHGGQVLVEHTVSTYVIDPSGRTREVAPYDLPARALADDVLALLGEAPAPVR